MLGHTCIVALLLVIGSDGVAIASDKVGARREGASEECWVRMPSSYRALQGELEVRWGAAPGPARALARHLQLVWTDTGKVAATKRLSSPGRVRFECGAVLGSGLMQARLMRPDGKPLQCRPGAAPVTSSVVVSWPTLAFDMPDTLETYSGPISVSMQLTSATCVPPSAVAADVASGPPMGLALQLWFCGTRPAQDGCGQGVRSVLNSQQLDPERFFRSGVAHVLLDCRLLGPAGTFRLALVMRMHHAQSSGDNETVEEAEDEEEVVVAVSPSIRVHWSDLFQLSLSRPQQHHGEMDRPSVFPCTKHLEVYWRSPNCLPGQDRIRLFALESGHFQQQQLTKMVYVQEKALPLPNRSTNRSPSTFFSTSNTSSLVQFACTLFSERFPRYCFVYVNVAASGAVSHVRDVCIPTLPLPESAEGAWGQWSSWSSCSMTCRRGPDSSSGVRLRHRFCDSPAPAFGAADSCPGAAVESAPCWGAMPCHPFVPPGQVEKDGSGEHGLDQEDEEETGPGCSCGCIMHFTSAPGRRRLGSSSARCIGRAIWLFQPPDPPREGEGPLRILISSWSLPCPGQSLRLRDGDSLSAPLLALLSAPGPAHYQPRSGPPMLLQASSPDGPLLLEFFSPPSKNRVQQGDSSSLPPNDECVGQAFFRATVIYAVANSSVLNISSAPPPSNWPEKLAASHAAILLLPAAATILLLFLLPLLVFLLLRRRRHLQRKKRKHLQTSPSVTSVPHADTPATSCTNVSVASFIGRRLRRGASTEEGAPMLRAEDGQKVGERRSRRTYSLPCSPLLVPKQKFLPRLQRHSSTEDEEEWPSDADKSKGKADANRKMRRCRTYSPLLLPASQGPKSPTSPTVQEDKTQEDVVEDKDSEMDSVKDAKEKSNLRRLLQRKRKKQNQKIIPAQEDSTPQSTPQRPLSSLSPSSTASLNGNNSGVAEDQLEMDYYDYDVDNAGAAPGSFFAFDPAFLLYIPPLVGSDESPSSPPPHTPLSSPPRTPSSSPPPSTSEKETRVEKDDSPGTTTTAVTTPTTTTPGSGGSTPTALCIHSLHHDYFGYADDTDDGADDNNDYNDDDDDDHTPKHSPSPPL